MGLRCACVGGGDTSFYFVHDALAIVVAASAISSAISSAIVSAIASAIATVIIISVAIFVANVCGATAASATTKALFCHIRSF